LLVNVPGSGVSVYLDGASVRANVNPIPLPVAWPSTPSYLSALGQPAPYAGGQCYLHELSVGGPIGSAPAISDAQITAALAALARYKTGKAPTVMLAYVGQSNMGNVVGSGGLQAARAEIAYLVRALACDFIPTPVAPGQPLIGSAAAPYVSYLTQYTPGGQLYTDPSLYDLGTQGPNCGAEFMAALALPSGPAYLRGCLAGIISYYSEAASAGTYADLATNVGAWRNFAGKVRAAQVAAGIPATAASLPFMFADNVSYFGTADGSQMVADAFEALRATGTDGFVPVIGMTLDSTNQGYTGSGTGSGSHADNDSLVRVWTRSAPAMARAILAAGAGDQTASIPSGAGGLSGLGPQITSAVWDSATKSALLTIQHDAGNDLTLPEKVLTTGLGFILRTNWVSPTNRGTLVFATSAIKESASTIRVYFAGATANLPASSRLFYGEQGVTYFPPSAGGVSGPTTQDSGMASQGMGRLGSGNAVMDNAASRVPASHPIATDLGPAFALNMPLRWTPAGVPIQ
jgi:hypothetical protein